jgi:hypothetical protein
MHTQETARTKETALSIAIAALIVALEVHGATAFVNSLARIDSAGACRVLEFCFWG